MSLKAFHLFFIGVSILTAFGFGVWSVAFHRVRPGGTYLVLGVLAFLIGIALIVYGVRFMQKLRHVR